MTIWGWNNWYTQEERRRLVRGGDLGEEKKRIILIPMPTTVPVEEPSFPEVVPAAEPVPA